MPEVVPPAPPAPVPVPVPAPHAGNILHPLSGVLILFLDYAFFAGEALTAGLGIPLAMIIAFTLSSTGIFLVQRHLAADRSGPAFAKAFVGGVITGIPTPLTGTIFATLILTLCGLNWLGRVFRGRG